MAIAITPNGKPATSATATTPNDRETMTPSQTTTNTAGKAIKAGNEPEVIVVTP